MAASSKRKIGSVVRGREPSDDPVSQSESETDTCSGKQSKSLSVAYGDYAERANAQDMCHALRQSVTVFHEVHHDFYEHNIDKSYLFAEYARYFIGIILMESARNIIDGDREEETQSEIDTTKLRITNFLRPLFPGNGTVVSTKLSGVAAGTERAAWQGGAPRAHSHCLPHAREHALVARAHVGGRCAPDPRSAPHDIPSRVSSQRSAGIGRAGQRRGG